DQLVGGRGRVGEDPEPAVGVFALVDAQIGYGPAADAVETVAPGDEVAVEGVRLAVLPVGHRRRLRVDAQHLGAEADVAAVGQPRGDQVLHDLGLRVDRHRVPTGQLGQ